MGSIQIVGSAGLRLRASPKIATDNIEAALERGLQVEVGETVTEGSRTWVRVTLSGYVDQAYLKPVAPPVEVPPANDYEGEWCSPLSLDKIYPPSTWQRANWRGAGYLLADKPAVHTGDDLTKRDGKTLNQPVYAIADGIVTYIRRDNGQTTWGNVLVYKVTKGDDFLYVRYAHLADIAVKVGDSIKAGQIVAHVGDSGMKGNPHLHFDMGVWNDPLLKDDPLNWPSSKTDTSSARSFIYQHYLDATLFLKEVLGQRQVGGGGLYRVVSSGKSNVRAGGGTQYPVIDLLPNGTVFRGTTDPGANWYLITDISTLSLASAIGGYISGTLIAPVNVDTPPVIIQPTQPPSASTAKNYFGLHIMNNAARDQVLPIVEGLAKAGRPMPLVTLLLVPGQQITVEDLRRVSPSTRIVARYYGTGDYQRDWDAATRADGAAYYRDVARGSITEEGRKADAIQLRDINEPGVGRGTNAWWQGVLDEAEADGVKVAVYCFSMGVPALPGDNLATSWFWTDPSTHDVLRRVRDRGHLFTLHQYAQMDQANPSWVDDWTIMRHKRFYAYLPADLKALPLWITEFGDEKLVAKGADQFMRNIQLAYDALRGGPVAGVALWSVGASSYQWEGDRIEALLPALRDTVMSMKA